MNDEAQDGEKPAVKTTIVGGRPPGCGKDVGQIPRGIEVLVKKASVDPSFRRLLLDKRAQAADEIGLKLSPAEVSMLTAIPAAQLEAVIASTKVEDRHVAAFMGKVAAVMLATLAVGAAVLCPTLGHQADYNSAGVRPDPDRNVRSVQPPAEPAAEPASGPASGPSTQPGPTRGIQPDVPGPISHGARPG